MQPVKLLEDYQLFILGFFQCSCCSVHRQYLCKPVKQRQYKVSAYQCPFFSLCRSPSVFLPSSSPFTSSQRRPASVFAVPPWSTRCLLRSWATSCRVAPEAATWPGTMAEARRQHTHVPSSYCSSPAQRASRYKDVHTNRPEAVWRTVVTACEWLSNMFLLK